MMTPLVLHLKREYWEAIRDGSKQEEYRLRTPYWERRLAGRTFSGIVLCLGYPARGDEQKRLYRQWKGVTHQLIHHALFGHGLVSVFAIDVSEVSL